MQHHLKFLLIATSLLFTACDSGGGGNSAPPPQPTLFELQSPVFFMLSTGIYSATNATNKPRLTPDFSNGDRYLQMAVSPDKQWIAMRARIGGEAQDTLYIVSTDGNTFAEVSVLNSGFSNVISFLWSPNSDRIVYQADDDINGNFELFVVTINNDNTFSTPQKVSGLIGINNSISSPSWSADGAFIAYTVLALTPTVTSIGVNTHEIGTISGDATFSVRVSKPAFVGSSIGFNYAWSPTENKLAYSGPVRSNNAEIFWVNASEQAASYTEADRAITQLTATQISRDYKWSNDGRYVAYVVFDTSSSFESLNTYDDDAGIPNATPLVTLNSSPPTYNWVADTNRIAVFHSTSSAYELTTINSDGSAEVNIAATGLSVQFAIAPDGSRLAVIDRNTPTASQLFFISADSATIQRSVDFADQQIGLSTLTDNGWSPNSQQLVLSVADSGTNISKLQTINAASGSPVTISDTGDNARAPRWSPESTHICHSKLTLITSLSQERDLICVTADGSDNTNLSGDGVENSTLEFTFDSKTPQRDST